MYRLYMQEEEFCQSRSQGSTFHSLGVMQEKALSCRGERLASEKGCLCILRAGQVHKFRKGEALI